jgi:hypothetical protein
MTARLLRRVLVIVGLLGILVPGSPASAAPIDYLIFDTDTLLNLGSFTVDPTLAAATGVSTVDMSAFTITDDIPTYGSLTVTLDDIISVTRPNVHFLNGQIQSISSNTQYTLGTTAVNVDIVALSTPADLNFVAVFQMFGATLPGLTNFHTGPIRGVGIKEAPVPEPSTMLLLALGGAVTAISRRRRQANARLLRV